ncbi:MAG: hypothetical protein WCP58_01855 [bacterium]
MFLTTISSVSGANESAGILIVLTLLVVVLLGAAGTTIWFVVGTKPRKK